MDISYSIIPRWCNNILFLSTSPHLIKFATLDVRWPLLSKQGHVAVTFQFVKQIRIINKKPGYYFTKELMNLDRVSLPGVPFVALVINMYLSTVLTRNGGVSFQFLCYQYDIELSYGFLVLIFISKESLSIYILYPPTVEYRCVKHASALGAYTITQEELGGCFRL